MVGDVIHKPHMHDGQHCLSPVEITGATHGHTVHYAQCTRTGEDLEPWLT